MKFPSLHANVIREPSWSRHWVGRSSVILAVFWLSIFFLLFFSWMRPVCSFRLGESSGSYFNPLVALIGSTRFWDAPVTFHSPIGQVYCSSKLHKGCQHFYKWHYSRDFSLCSCIQIVPGSQQSHFSGPAAFQRRHSNADDNIAAIIAPRVVVTKAGTRYFGAQGKWRLPPWEIEKWPLVREI